ncbi:MAG: hypothetical protein QOG54_1084 [Actinomycetota bacterium]|jgi:hypothetical protein|nr:hypothetical protein [Actinomycetota bacterium]
MRQLRLAGIFMTAFLMASCGHTALDGPKMADGGLLFVEDGDRLTAFDPASGTSTWSAPDVLMAPGLGRGFRLAPTSGSPRLIALDPTSGGEVAAMGVPNGLTLRVASSTGRSVALVSGGESSVYDPVARDHTTIVVAKPDEGTMKRFELKGNFEPEAFSTDDSKLYMIEYVNDDMTRYRVRMMRIHSGDVLPIGRLTKAAPDIMRGIGRTQVYSPDASVLYTLYTKQPPNTAHRDASDIINKHQVHAFVHVLNLDEDWAHCIDLPMPFGLDTDPATLLTISPDGSWLYAGDGRRIAVIDTYEQAVSNLQKTDEVSGSAKALVGPDERLYVGDGSKIEIFDGGTLDPIGTFEVPAGIGALGMSTDGLRLFVGGEHQVFVIDSKTGAELTSMRAPGADRILFTAARD